MKNTFGKATKLTALLLCLFLMLLPTGCSRGGGTQEETTQQETEVETTEKTTSKAMSDKIIIAGVGVSSAPFGTKDKNGFPTGFDIAMMNLIGTRLGAQTVIEEIEAGKELSSTGNYIELVAASVAADSHNTAVSFSDPYYTGKLAVLVASGDNSITDAKSLNGKKVGVRPGMKSLLEGKKLGLAATEYYDSSLAVADLSDGKLDALILDEASVRHIEKSVKNVSAVEGIDLGEVSYCVILPKGDTALAAEVNAAIAEILSSGEGGEYESIVKQYLTLDE